VPGQNCFQGSLQVANCKLLVAAKVLVRYKPAFAVEISFCGKSRFLWEASVFAVKPDFCRLLRDLQVAGSGAAKQRRIYNKTRAGGWDCFLL